MGKADRKPTVFKYADVNFTNSEVSSLNKTGKQPLAYINYNDPKLNAETKLLAQSDKIKLTTHGIPQLDKEGEEDGFYPDDSKREFIKIPLDDQEGALALRKHLEEADEHFGSEELRKQLFGKRAKEYEYQPCIKTPQVKQHDNDDDDEAPQKGKKSSSKAKETKEKKEPRPIVDYVKMKFHVVVVGDGKEKKRVVKTKLIRLGKKKEVIKAETMTDVANEIRWNSEIKFIFYYCKIWANKTPAQGAKVIPYGIGFKIMAIEYVPSAGKTLDADEIDFLSEEEDETVTTNKNSKKKKFDDDDDEDDANSEEQDNKSKKHNSKKKNVSKNEDNESEEADDTKKKSKNKSNGKKSSKDNNETDDEQEDVSTKKGDKGGKKLSGKKSSKNNDEEDDSQGDSPKKSQKKSKKSTIDDEDEEEIKPKKGKNSNRSK